jgi:hypothetical protein
LLPFDWASRDPNKPITSFSLPHLNTEFSTTTVQLLTSNGQGAALPTCNQLQSQLTNFINQSQTNLTFALFITFSRFLFSSSLLIRLGRYSIRFHGSTDGCRDFVILLFFYLVHPFYHPHHHHRHHHPLLAFVTSLPKLQPNHL